MKINELLQLARLQYLFSKDNVLKHDFIPRVASFSKKAEYDIKVLKRIAINYNDNVYNCLNIILNEHYLNKNSFLNKLLKYRYLDSNGLEIDCSDGLLFLGTFRIQYDDFDRVTSYDIIAPSTDMNTMLHEFYHFSSFHKIDEVDYTGFRKDELGKGLNEGFTQYLTNIAVNDGNMSYKKNDGISVNYPFCTTYAKLLTDVLGMDSMKDNYFNKGLDGVIQDIYKIYPDKEKIMRFIGNIDYFCFVDDGRYNNKQEAVKVMEEIDSFFMDLGTAKYKDNSIIGMLPNGISETHNRLFPTDLLYEGVVSKSSKK